MRPYGEGVIYEMRQTMNAVGLNDLGTDVSNFQDMDQLSPGVRAENVDQDTTLQDF